MSTERDVLYKGLVKVLRIHPFLLEILDLGGFDTLVKLKGLNKDVVSELLKEAADNLQIFEHFKDYSNGKYEDILDGKLPFKLKLGDRTLLETISTHLPSLEKRLGPKIKRLPLPSIPTKRKSIEQDEEVVQESQPKVKKLKGTVVDNMNAFNSFVSKWIPPPVDYVVLFDNRVKPKFMVRCVNPKCVRPISVGWKESAKEMPHFMSCNITKHPCFKARIEAHKLSQKENVPLNENDDSGVG